MSLNQEKIDTIINHIRGNHDATETRLEHDFVRFETDTTVGYIPRPLLQFFRESSDFQYDGSEIRFASHINDFNSKTWALNNMRDRLIDCGVINRKPNHWADEEFAIGGNDRLANPEFTIDRAYAYIYGFEFDAVSFQLRTRIESNDYIVTQLRGPMVAAPNTYDFVAGGAVKYPEKSALEAIQNQIDHEVGSHFVGLAKNAFHMATIKMSHILKIKTPNAKEFDAIERSRILLFDSIIPKNKAKQIAKVSTEEAKSFHFLTPQDILKYCTDGNIDPVMIQSFLAALIATNLIPDTHDLDRIKDTLLKSDVKFNPPHLR